MQYLEEPSKVVYRTKDGTEEIDYTFYRLLLETNGNPTQNFHVLKNYQQGMKNGDLVLLKVPQVIIARKLRRGRKKGKMVLQCLPRSDKFRKTTRSGSFCS